MLRLHAETLAWVFNVQPITLLKQLCNRPKSDRIIFIKYGAKNLRFRNIDPTSVDCKWYMYQLLFANIDQMLDQRCATTFNRLLMVPPYPNIAIIQSGSGDDCQRSPMYIFTVSTLHVYLIGKEAWDLVWTNSSPSPRMLHAHTSLHKTGPCSSSDEKDDFWIFCL